MWTGPIKTGLFFAPIILVGVLGGLYVAESVETLLAPGVPIELQIPTPGGPIEFKATNYAIDPIRGTLALRGLEIREANGATILACRTFFASGIGLGDSLRPRIAMSDADATVIRLNSGRFALQDLFPKSKEEPGKVPFQLSITSSRIRYLDLGSTKKEPEIVNLKDVTVTGLGNNLNANYQLSSNTFGTLNGSVTKIGSTIEVQIRGADLAVENLLTFLRSTRERTYLDPIKNLQLRATQLTGSGIIRFDPAGIRNWETDIAVTAGNSSLNDVLIDRWNFKGRILHQSITGALSAEKQGAMMQFNGRLDFPSFLAKISTAKTSKAKTSLVKTQEPTVNPMLVVNGNLSLSKVNPGVVKSFLPGKAKEGWTLKNLSLETSASLAIPIKQLTGGSKPSKQPRSPIVFATQLLKDGPQTETVIAADSVTYGSVQFLNPRIRVSQDRDKSVVHVEQLGVNRQPVHGFLTLDHKAQTIEGALEAQKMDLADIGPTTGPVRMRGTASAAVQLTGTLTNPKALFRASGNPSLRFQNRWVNLGRAEAIGTYEGGALILDRAILEGDLGSAIFRGGLARDQRLAGTLTAIGLRLDPLFPNQFQGSIDIKGSLSGPLSTPLLAGRVEGYQIGTKEIRVPAAVADITLSKESLKATNLQILKGAGSISGTGTLFFKGSKIFARAEAQGLLLRDFVNGDFSGIMNAESIEISGTIQEPTVTATVEVKNLIAAGFQVKEIASDVKWVQGTASFTDLEAILAGGTVKGSGYYTPTDQRGVANVKFEDVEVKESVARFAPTLPVTGAISGDLSLSLRKNALDRLSAKGLVDELEVNRASAGSGSWDVKLEENKWLANVDLGQIERYIQLQEITYDELSKKIGGSITLGKVPVPEIALAADSFFAWTPEQQGLVEDLAGTVSVNVELTGSLDQPEFKSTTLNIEKFSIEDRVLGDIEGVASLTGQEINLSSLSLKGDQLAGFMAGKIGLGRDGLAELEGKIGSLDLSFFSSYVPELANVKSEVRDFSFSITGPLRRPSLQASLDGSISIVKKQIVRKKLSEPITQKTTLTFDPEREPVNLTIYRLEFKPDENGKGLVNFDGKVGYSVFQGDFQGAIPVAMASGLEKDAPLKASIKLNPQSLSRLIDLFPTVDYKGTTEIKTINETAKPGSDPNAIQMSGTLNNIQVNGSIVAKADQLLLYENNSNPNLRRAFTTFLKDVNLKLSGEGQTIGFSATARSSASSTKQNPDLVFASKIDVSDLLNTSLPPLPLLERPIKSATLLVDRLRVRQQGFEFSASSQPNAFVDITLSSTDATQRKLTPIQISGTLSKPRIVGKILVDSAEATLPTLPQSESGVAVYPIDPEFALDVILNSRITTGNPGEVHIRASTSDLFLSGQAEIRGKLSKPELYSNLIVEKGTLRLPGGLIRLDQGGSIKIDFQSDSTAAASLKADMVGRTRITSLRNGIIPERYEITLAIRGNLLVPGGLILDASSDPPDLPRDRIFALLGQTDLLQGLFGQNGNSDLSSELGNAVAGYAIPTLLGGVTDQIARGLGFEYFSVDFNAVEQTSLSFAKGFGNGFFAIGRSQLAEPLPGENRIFDFRFSYRPRRGTDFVKALSFSLGVDQDRPYRISIDYSGRYGSLIFPYQRIELKRPK